MKNLYLAVLLVCSSIYSSNAQIGYAGIIESGVFNVVNDTINVPITRLFFSTSFSNGLTLGKNGYLGIGVSYNRYEKMALMPITIDFKYCLFGNGFSSEPESFSLFFGLSGGRSFELDQPIQTNYNTGLFLKSNIGAMIHVNSDARLVINLGHKVQEPKKRIVNVNQFQSIYASVGLVIRPTRSEKKAKTRKEKKKEAKKSPLDMLKQ